jgi:hypothetical protein
MLSIAGNGYQDVQTIAPLQLKSKPRYSFLPIALLHMKMWTIEEEAKRLAARFQGVNRAAFARDFKVKGGQSMIYQHITGRRPISIEAAQAYARGFDCPLEEISPRLAMEAHQALSLTGDVRLTVEEPKAEYQALTKEQEQMLAFMANLDKDANKVLLNMGALLSRRPVERRKKDIGHNPERRLGPDIPPDPHDTRFHNHPPIEDMGQLQRRKKGND